MLLRALRVPIGWKELPVRTAREVLADNCLGLAAQLAYYFFLALFPALLFLVAIVSFISVAGLLDTITTALARVAPSDVISILQEQILKIAHEKNGGLLTAPRQRLDLERLRDWVRPLFSPTPSSGRGSKSFGVVPP